MRLRNVRSRPLGGDRRGRPLVLKGSFPGATPTGRPGQQEMVDRAAICGHSTMWVRPTHQRRCRIAGAQVRLRSLHVGSATPLVDSARLGNDIDAARRRKTTWYGHRRS